MDMGPLIYQMCATRLAQSDNPAAAQLLAQMNGADGGAPPDLREMMQALAGQDPTMQLVLQHLEAMRSGREEPNHTIEGEAEESGGALADPREEAILELRSQVESMYRELSALRRRNEDLALALGACPACWGEERECHACRGRGVPGHAKPDTEAFLYYVVPAGRTWRAFKSFERADARARPPSTGRTENVRLER